MAKDKKGAKPVTDDERFKGVHNDPRFNLPKRNDFKVKLDDRFKKSDLNSIKKRSKIDKYGRKVDTKQDTFDKYFESKDKNESKSKKAVAVSDEESGSDEDEDDKEEEEIEESDDESSSEEDDDDEEEEENDTAVTMLDRARGKGITSDAESSEDESSSDESSSSEDSESEDDSDAEQYAKPEVGDPSRRLAVVNLDWDHVKSVDLMATFQSFVPNGGLIESVSIYPSEFGKERMGREDIEGPPRDMFKKKKGKHDDSDSDSEIEAKDLYEEGDGNEDYDSKSLRKYQLQRLRYYYAVVVCDSINTAKAIYDNCDGTEYESTANLFDLRYIPDEMEFNDDEPRDTCDKIPSNYQPESFVTDALQHSKVRLTWDETPAERVKMSAKAFSQRELDDMDFKAYLASDNSDSDEDNQTLKDTYKNLAGSSTKIGDKNIFDFGKDDKDDVDMEITFTPALASGDKKASQGGDDGEVEESTLDKLKRKAKERRRARKEKLKELKNKELAEKKEAKNEAKSKKHKKSSKEDDAKSKAELELLMMDEDNDSSSKPKAQHFNLKELVRSEKEKSKKSKHRNKDKIIEDDFQVDLQDPRFNEIFTNHDFAIDPTQPQFKKTATMQKILEERSKRRVDDDESEEVSKKQSKKSSKRKLEDAGGNETDVKALAQKLKRKALKK